MLRTEKYVGQTKKFSRFDQRK